MACYSRLSRLRYESVEILGVELWFSSCKVAESLWLLAPALLNWYIQSVRQNSGNEDNTFLPFFLRKMKTYASMLVDQYPP